MASDSESTSVIQSLDANRGRIGELVLLAVLLALGINLLSSGVAAFYRWSPLLQVTVGLGLVAIGSAYALGKLLGRRERRIVIDAVLPYHPDGNKVVELPRYRFSEQLSRNLAAAFSENAAFRAVWDEDPLSKGFYRAGPTPDSPYVRSAPRSAQLVVEAVEYEVLERLSTTLTDYFASADVRESELVELGREDVPDILLRNRLLDLFSRPMEDRPAFRKMFPDGAKGRRVVAAYSPGGMYSQFDLILPRRSVVRRYSPSAIEIKTPRFTLKLGIEFHGMGVNAPRGFIEHYVGEDPLEIREMSVGIEVSVRFSRLALWTPLGWKYFHWVDRFIEVLRSEASFDAFLKAIDWEGAYTVLIASGESGSPAKPRGKPTRKLQEPRVDA